MKVIAIPNHKGGVGKTTTTINLAAGIAKVGHSVLIIDLDPQGNSTMGIGLNLNNVIKMPTIADIFINNISILDVITDTSEQNLKIVPADIRLSKAAKLLYQKPFKEILLKRSLEKLNSFDYVLIDCQPSLDVLTQNALVAADRILIPTTLTGFALQGLGDLIDTIVEIEEYQSHGDSTHQINKIQWKILLTKVSGFGLHRNEAAQAILSPLESNILKTQIRLNEAIENSQMEMGEEPLTPVILKPKWSKGAQDYKHLTKEILEIWPC